MKRLFTLFLLLLLLTGCSAGGNGGTPTAVDAETFNTGVGQSTCAVTVTVNPQIKIFLDDARNVTAIQCVNEDAKTLFGGEYVSMGKPFDEVLKNVLNTLHKGGYLVSGSDLHFGIFAKEQAVMDEASTAAREITQSFCEKKDMEINPSYNSSLAEYILPEGVQGVTLNEYTVDYKRDEMGRIIWVLENAPEGRMECFYNERGARIRSIQYFDSGSTLFTWFDETDGRPIRQYGIEPGMEITSYDENDMPLTAVYKDSSGNTLGSVRFENGTPVYEEKVEPDGRRVTFTYSSSGLPVSMTVVYPDGEWQEETYYDNGKRKHLTIYTTNGITSVYNFSEDGRSGSATMSNGTVETLYYYDNGTTEKRIVDYRNCSDRTDELYMEATYASDGTPLTSYSLRDGGHEIYATYHGGYDIVTYVHHYGGETWTDYWIGNINVGGISPNGNAWGDTFDTYSGPIQGGTIGVG